MTKRMDQATLGWPRHLPPVAVEDLLLEEGSIGAEERSWVLASGVGVQQAHVVGLALELGVSVVTWKSY